MRPVELMAAGSWMSSFWQLQLGAAVALVILITFLIPRQHPFFTSFAGVVVLIGFSWICLIEAWRRLIRETSR